jgi:hypothetical protein
MLNIDVRNVSCALPYGVNWLTAYGERQDSRNGPVLVVKSPVITTYRRPKERVLTCPWRDANPFFHLMESMWMLAGRNDVEFLLPYLPDFGRFADDGVIHGAYGHRWRSAFGHDQLRVIVEKLRKNGNDRQAVLQHWDCGMYDDLAGDWRDRPCNTHVYFRIRSGALDMTVCCRSNDAIWGAHGANAVHFSFLQEYVAAMVGVPVGVYFQLSNDYHLYLDVKRQIDEKARHRGLDGGWLEDDRYRQNPTWLLRDLVRVPETFDGELRALMSCVEYAQRGEKLSHSTFTNEFLDDVVLRAARAHAAFRDKDWASAMGCADSITSDDWRAACVEWLERRTK